MTQYAGYPLEALRDGLYRESDAKEIIVALAESLSEEQRKLREAEELLDLRIQRDDPGTHPFWRAGYAAGYNKGHDDGRNFGIEAQDGLRRERDECCSYAEQLKSIVRRLMDVHGMNDTFDPALQNEAERALRGESIVGTVPPEESDEAFARQIEARDRSAYVVSLETALMWLVRGWRSNMTECETYDKLIEDAKIVLASKGNQMRTSKPFSELREKMSPEAQERAAARTEEIVSEVNAMSVAEPEILRHLHRGDK